MSNIKNDKPDIDANETVLYTRFSDAVIDELSGFKEHLKRIDGAYRLLSKHASDHILDYGDYDELRSLLEEIEASGEDTDQATLLAACGKWNQLNSHFIVKRIEFILFTNTQKIMKLIESLFFAANTRNYLIWMSSARSIIEYSAAINYYNKKLTSLIKSQDFGIYVTVPGQQMIELTRVLDQYSHGSRFNWRAELDNDLEELLSNPSIEGQTNIITMLKHLSKKEDFHDTDYFYSKLSDFIHPNMGSHLLVMNLDTGNPREILVTSELNHKQVTWILEHSCHPIAKHLQNIAEALLETRGLMLMWLDIITREDFRWPLEGRPIFRWDHVPGEDEEGVKDFLRTVFNADWVENATINNDRNEIKLSSNGKWIRMKLKRKKGKVTIESSDGGGVTLQAGQEDDDVVVFLKLVPQGP